MTEYQLAANTPNLPPPKLLDLVRGKIRLKHDSIRTEQAYVDWIKRYTLTQAKLTLIKQSVFLHSKRLAYS